MRITIDLTPEEVYELSDVLVAMLRNAARLAPRPTEPASEPPTSQPAPARPPDEVLDLADDSDDPRDADGPVEDGGPVNDADATDDEYRKLIKRGRTAFIDFLHAWLVNYDCDEDEHGEPVRPQPDRIALIQTTMARDGRAMLAYIASEGIRSGVRPVEGEAHVRGLRAAVKACVPADAVPEDADFNEWTDALAGNIVQVASAIASPLSEMIEYYVSDEVTG